MSKVNGKCVYEGKRQKKYLIHEVKCSMCEAIYIGNTQQTSNKRMEGHFSYLLRCLKNGQKSDSFAAHFEQYFNSTTPRTTPRTDLYKYMTFKVVNQLNSIGAMKCFKKTNSNLGMKERLKILKNYLTNTSRL